MDIIKFTKGYGSNNANDRDRLNQAIYQYLQPSARQRPDDYFVTV